MDKRDTQSGAPSVDSRFADRSRLMQLLAQSFSIDGNQLTEAEREDVTKLAASQLGISPEAARSAYDQWQSEGAM